MNTGASSYVLRSKLRPLIRPRRQPSTKGKNAVGLKTGMPRQGFNTTKSSSLLTKASARQTCASARNLLSFGSRHGGCRLSPSARMTAKKCMAWRRTATKSSRITAPPAPLSGRETLLRWLGHPAPPRRRVERSLASASSFNSLACTSDQRILRRYDGRDKPDQVRVAASRQGWAIILLVAASQEYPEAGVLRE